MRSQVIQLLQSSDIEMVQLGASLLKNLPRKEWSPLLREYARDYIFTICHNKVTIWSRREEVTCNIGYNNSKFSTYTYIIEDYTPSRDIDEDMEKDRRNRIERENRKYKIKTNKYERKESKRTKCSYTRTRANAFAGN